MAIQNLILGVHVVGACITGIIVVRALYNIFQNNRNEYQHYAQSLAVSAAFQVLSGIALTLATSPQPSLGSFCARIGLYAAVVVSVEAALMYAAHRGGVRLVLSKSITSSFVVSIASILATITILL